MMGIYSKVFRTILFPGYERIKGRRTSKLLTDAEHRLSWSAEMLHQYQFQQLQKLLNYCQGNVPYYQNLWRDIDFHPNDLSSVEQIQQLPLLTKDDVKEHYQSLIPSSKQKTNYRKSTGGSTGTPFHFELDKGSYESRHAIMWRTYGSYGVGPGTKTWYLWGENLNRFSHSAKLKETLFHRFYHRKFANSFHMSRNNLVDYIAQYNRYKPSAVVAYVAPLYALAKYINQKGMIRHQPNIILTGAEPLYEYQRQEIQMAFNCKVLNTYGCREFMLIASECEQQRGLHINVDQLVVETVDEHGTEVKNKPGDIVITDLFNFGMPLIRYVNGDQGVISDRRCSCANPLPMLESVNGRKLDVIRSLQGNILPGEFFPHIFKDYRGVEQFQVRQKSLATLDIYLVLNERFKKINFDKINARIKGIMGEGLQINYHCVDSIPLTNTGKFRVTISEL